MSGAARVVATIDVQEEAEAILGTARLMVRAKAPFFATGLTKLTFVARPGLNTIGVTYRGVLIYDPAWVAQQGIEKSAGLLVHEALHILDHHGDRRGSRDPARWNRNADRAINTIVRDMGFKLPDGPDTGCWPSDLGPGTPEGLTAEQYHELDLQQEAAKKAKQPQGEPGEDEDEEPGEEPAGEPGEGAQDEEPGEGSEGEPGEDEDGGDPTEGSGEEPGEDGDGSEDAEEPSEGSGEGSGSGEGGDPSSEDEEPGEVKPGDPHGVGRGQCGSCAGNALDDEANINPEDERSEAEMQRIAKQMAMAIQEHAAAGRGGLPAGLRLLADAVTGIAKVRWQQKLQQAVKRAARVRSGANVYRFDGPSKRQAGIGYGVGRALMPRPRAVVPNVALMIDTSGSMGRTEMTAALRESAAVIKTLNAPLLYGTCDCAVHTLQKITSVSDLVKLLKGGGGTSFVPAFKALDALKGEQRPEVVIFVTDGDGDAPVTCPPGMAVIWLLVGPYKRKPSAEGQGYSSRITWGTYIEVDD
jgi:predicted metal-dependent peptidase